MVRWRDWLNSHTRVAHDHAMFSLSFHHQLSSILSPSPQPLTFHQKTKKLFLDSSISNHHRPCASNRHRHPTLCIAIKHATVSDAQSCSRVVPNHLNSNRTAALFFWHYRFNVFKCLPFAHSAHSSASKASASAATLSETATAFAP